MEKDRVFAQKQTVITPFKFSREVAQVFDDMLIRSVPFYGEALKQQARMAKRFYLPGTRIYDLGCSHGNMGILILDAFDKTPFSMTAVDNSKPMIEKYTRRLERRGGCRRIELVCTGMEDILIKDASVVIINLTLQFLAPEKRDRLIRNAYQGLKPGGVLLLTEKTRHPDEEISRLELDFYREFKRENGYSDLEISQKRDALEKVLIPEPAAVHENRIRKAGFEIFNIWLKWFNFTSMLAQKR